ncbi:unnamed protein product [Sphagnum troendelagicum]
MAEEESEMEKGSEASSPTSDNLVTDAAPPPPPPPPSEIQTNLAEYAKFVADKLDTLFDTTTKIQVDMANLENKLRIEFDGKIKAHHELAIARISALEKLTYEQGLKLDEHKSTQNQQATQLDDLQNQVGILFFRFH